MIQRSSTPQVFQTVMYFGNQRQNKYMTYTSGFYCFSKNCIHSTHSADEKPGCFEGAVLRTCLWATTYQSRKFYDLYYKITNCCRGGLKVGSETLDPQLLEGGGL